MLVYLKEGPDAPAGAAGGAPAPSGPAISRAAAAGAAVRRPVQAAAARGRSSARTWWSAIWPMPPSAPSPMWWNSCCTDDGKQVVYAVGARDSAKNGVFAVKPGSGDAPAALIGGQGQIRQADLGRKPDAGGLPQRSRRFGRQAAEMEALSLGPASAGGLRAGGRRHAWFPQGIRDQRQRYAELFEGRHAPVLRVCAPPPPEKKADAADAPPTIPRPWWTSGAIKTTTSSPSRRCAPSATAIAPSRRPI